MQGLLMIPELVKQTISHKKTMTRREGSLKQFNKNPDDYVALNPSAVLKNKNKYYYLSDKKGNVHKAIARFKVGEIVFLKEPYIPYGESWDQIKYLYTDSPEAKGLKFNNKMFMPTDAARYFIEITNISIQRMHDISEADCIAEGIEKDLANWKNYLPKGKFSSCKTPKESFFTLYNKANGCRSNKPVDNIWVFVYQFKYLENYKHGKI